MYVELDFAQSNSSFALQNCYQKISRDKQASKTEGNTIYQNPSIDITGDTSGYDNIAYNKNQEEETTYDHLH